MDELLRYYEEELGLFGRFAREFRARYPKPAGDLHLAGEHYDDPSVARLIQSVALLSARIQKRLDDDYPAFTEALLDSLAPHYLRPLPSYSVAQVGYRDAAEIPDTATLLARGTVLRGGAGHAHLCRFRTVYDVVLAPLHVAALRYAAVPAMPPGQRPPRGMSGAIALTIACPDGRAGLRQALPTVLRLFADGEASTRAALLDALFLHGAGAWLQAEADPAWLPLRRAPLRIAGLAEADAMIPFPARSHPALRLLTEYFSYPEKFNFVDLDCTEIRALLPPRCTRFTLHLGLQGLGADWAHGDGARALAGIDARNLLPGCTPVVNLFPKAGAPLQIDHTRADYPLVADAAHAASYDIHSVDAVRLVRDGAATPFAPLYEDARDADAGADAGDHGGDGDEARPRRYWVTRRDRATAALGPGHELRIALVDDDFRSTDAGGATLSTELTCTNRDLPARLRYGDAAGDLRADALAGVAPIRMLRKPTPTRRFDGADAAHWALIAHLAPDRGALTTAGLPDFRRMLALYDPARSPVARRQIAGIVGIEHGAVRSWVPTAPVATLMPGIGIRLTVDEDAFAGSGLYAFTQVLDRYFALNGQLNCTTQLTVVSRRTGAVLIACPPRASR